MVQFNKPVGRFRSQARDIEEARILSSESSIRAVPNSWANHCTMTGEHHSLYTTVQFLLSDPDCLLLDLDC